MSRDLYALVRASAARAEVSVAEWLRQAARERLRADLEVADAE